MSLRVSPDYLASLQSKTENIRNFCILAHVDHGKTTLSDSLLCSNGLFSAKLAGRLRYLDSTEEEQKRGITMHSSAISLLYKLTTPTATTAAAAIVPQVEEAAPDAAITGPDSSEYLINLVDSPGHIDFSSDVSTATRLCDGALIVVDVLEGVCTQTHAVLYKALKERIRPCLVLNKIDRLCVEARLTPVEAFGHLRRIVENVNAVAATLLNAELTKLEYETGEVNTSRHGGGADDDENPLVEQWSFQPERGNVVFASALDCWGFGLMKFANMWAKRLDVSNKVLQKYLFDDYSFNASTKKITKHDPSAGRADSFVPMFASMILEPLWQIYDVGVIQGDVERVAKMASKALGVSLAPREINVKDPRGTVQTILRQWLPLPDAILRMVVRCMPHPAEAQRSRLETLLPSGCAAEQSSSPEQEGALAAPAAMLQRVRRGVAACGSSNNDETVVFVSKMTPIKAGDLCPQDFERLRASRSGADATTEVFVALARVYSGVLRPDSRLFVLGHHHDPWRAALGAVEAAVAGEVDCRADPGCGASPGSVALLPEGAFGLYLCLGPSVHSISEARAGNIVAIYGLEEHILKTATLCSTWAAHPLRAITFQAKPTVCVAVEPSSHADLPRLELGLKKLYQYDPVVEVAVDSSGQHTITCLGELHLEQCLKDLREKFAACELSASAPLIFYRETVLGCSLASDGQRATLPPPWGDLAGVERSSAGRFTVSSSGGLLSLSMRCCALPLPVVRLCEDEAGPLRILAELLTSTPWTGGRRAGGESIRVWRSLSDALFDNDTGRLGVGVDTNVVDEELQRGGAADKEAFGKQLYARIVAMGPHVACTNVLLLGSGARIAVVSSSEELPLREAPRISELFDRVWQRVSSAVVAGFQAVAAAGPLMHEPLHGVCFVIEDLTVDRSLLPFLSDSELGLLIPSNPNPTPAAAASINSGQLVTDVSSGLRLAMLSCPLRVVEMIYLCDLQCDQSQLGNLYAVVARRRGEIVKEDIIEGTALFVLTATLPVAESFGFAQELLKKTSGNATTPQLKFSHWQANETDPFWRPRTKAELEAHGGGGAEVNAPRTWIDAARKRKGLSVEEKIVVNAEKQRNLSKNI